MDYESLDDLMGLLENIYLGFIIFQFLEVIPAFKKWLCPTSGQCMIKDDHVL